MWPYGLEFEVVSASKQQGSPARSPLNALQLKEQGFWKTTAVFSST